MRLTRRNMIVGFLTFQVIGAILYLISMLVLSQSTTAIIATGIATVVSIALLYAGWRDWRYVGPVNTIMMVILIGIGTTEQTILDRPTLIIFVPSAVALILARPFWILSSMVALILIYLLRSGVAHGFWTVYTGDLRNLPMIVFTTVAMFLSRLVSDNAQRAVEQEASRLVLARSQAEQQAAEITHQAEKLTQQTIEQHQLLELLNVLETPAVSVAHDVLLAPLVGRLDSARLERLSERLLQDVARQRARLVILDVAGVFQVDHAVATRLQQIGQALRMLGCSVAITGLTSTVAQTLVDADVNFAGITTLRSPEEALAHWNTSRLLVT